MERARKAAIEILINRHRRATSCCGAIPQDQAIMSKSREMGMKTFDWSLFELNNEGATSYEEAIRNSDSANELRLNIKLNATRQPNEFAVAVSAPSRPALAWPQAPCQKPSRPRNSRSNRS